MRPGPSVSFDERLRLDLKRDAVAALSQGASRHNHVGKGYVCDRHKRWQPVHDTHYSG